MSDAYEYGIWSLTIISIIFFTLFILSFFLPREKREWQALGLFEASVVALYAEMYGFPLTIYLLSSFLGTKIPFVHFKGHLGATLLGLGDKLR